jgi:YhcH/YjgK/YiaL family protein
MIYDSLQNLERYTSIPNVNEIVRFIERTDLHNLTLGDLQIKGDDLYVKVLRYKPQDASRNYFETHREYIDVQIVLDGVDLMQVVQPQHLTVTDEFKLEGDFVFYKATECISDIVVSKNEFAVFFPGEPHKPGCSYRNNNCEVYKLVFKVRK